MSFDSVSSNSPRIDPYAKQAYSKSAPTQTTSSPVAVAAQRAISQTSAPASADKLSKNAANAKGSPPATSAKTSTVAYTTLQVTGMSHKEFSELEAQQRGPIRERSGAPLDKPQAPPRPTTPNNTQRRRDVTPDKVLTPQEAFVYEYLENEKSYSAKGVFSSFVDFVSRYDVPPKDIAKAKALVNAKPAEQSKFMREFLQQNVKNYSKPAMDVAMTYISSFYGNNKPDTQVQSSLAYNIFLLKTMSSDDFIGIDQSKKNDAKAILYTFASLNPDRSKQMLDSNLYKLPG